MGAQYNFPVDAFADEAISVTDTAVGFTAATYAPTDAPGAVKALVTVETAAVRMRIDGSTATSTVGHLLDPGDSVVIEGTDSIINASFVRDTSTSGAIHVTYFR